MFHRFIAIIAVLVTVPSILPTRAAERLRYDRDIRPILAENCFSCHGQDATKRKAEVQLNTQSGQRAKGVIVPGKPEKSSLVARIFSRDADELMPPPKSHRVLTAPQKQMIKRWVAEGAPFSGHWAFQAPTRGVLPKVKNAGWVRNEIDRFVLAKLETQGLRPAAEADRATLIRRLSLDLTGLPPTPAEVDAFAADTAADAYEKVVDRLLKSEHYGERMALPWLDAARYADSNGFQQDGDTYQWIWRDWVVRALNADLPFDRFSIEQLAGDLLPQPTNDQLIATAFNRNHLLNGEGGAIPEEQRFNILFDRVDTTATTWLGLTLACAQCHDHKYDPLTQRDYYGLLHSFNQVSESGTAGFVSAKIRAAPPVLEIKSPDFEAGRTVKQQEIARQIAAAPKDWEAQLKALQRAWEEEMLAATVPEESGWKRLAQDVREAKPDKPNTYAAGRLRTEFELVRLPKLQGHDELKRILAAKTALDVYEKDEVPRVMVMRNDRPRDTFILDRGEYLKPKEKVGFATPAFLPAPPKDSPTNRLGFAQWLFLPEHPLTARVQVNRMWQHFFGSGIVKTVEDLGVQSEVPVHQPLLDWLSVEFREHGWSMKHVHRLIVTSATYRQSSRVKRSQWQRDPENRLLSRGARFRAPAMILRDGALAASGLLDRRVGGKPVYPYQPDGIWETLAITKERDFTYPASSGADLYRRSLYTFWRRTVGPANMFDASNRQVCKVRQNITSTPLHALTTLNDPTWAEAARVLAARSLETGPGADSRLTFAFRSVLGRKPTAADLAALRHAFDRQLAIYQADKKSAAAVVALGTAPGNPQLEVSEHAALSAVCLAILNLDEALTRE